MPYIKSEDRTDPTRRQPETFGELNYAITMLCHEYVKRVGASYTLLSGVVGVLECAKMELYRRVIAPYEDEKIQENGDILP